MSTYFRKIIALVLAGHFTFAPAKGIAQVLGGGPPSATPNEFNRFKNSSGQDSNMANGTAVKERRFDLAELEGTYTRIMAASKPDIPSNLSLYQQGQLLTYCFFQFYKLPPNERQNSEDGKKLYAIITKLYENSNQTQFKKYFYQVMRENLVGIPHSLVIRTQWINTENT